MKKKLLLAFAIGIVASCAAAFGVGCSSPNSADNTPTTPPDITPITPPITTPEHNYGEWVVDREATCIEVGRKYHTCQDEGCNETEWESIPKTAHKNDIIHRTKEGHSFTCSFCNTTTEIEPHNFKNGICTACGADENEDYNFEFELSGDNEYYIIKSGTDINATEIIIPSTYKGRPVKAIGAYAFKNYASLKNVLIPDSVISIGWFAFCGCSGLTTITIPDSVTSIGYSAFNSCSGLTSITIPDSVTTIATGMFYCCTSLEELTIPDSVTSIGTSAFEGCGGLTSIIIPDSVTSIGTSAFSNCGGLTSITVGENNTVYKSENNCILSKGGTTLILGCKTSVMPDSVTCIGNYAFEGCSGLTSINIPDSVESIWQSAFEGCTGLTSVTIPDSVTNIDYSAFKGCSGLTSITIPDSVTGIGISAFSSCTSLTSIIIPDSVKYIGSWAFRDCSGLTIYCEAEEKPSGWGSEWNYSNCPVVWGYKGDN